MKPDWNAKQYLKFKAERTQPSRDLANRIEVQAPAAILDVGCGPGNSSHVLKERFPQAHVCGIDSSPDMIEKAKENYNNIEFAVHCISPECTEISGTYDIIFSNACIQWIPDHKTLIPRLFEKVNPGGALAIQIPMTAGMPMQQILKYLKALPEWQTYFKNINDFYTLTPEEYCDIVNKITPDSALWSTSYMHMVCSYDDIIEWYRGSGMRPYLAALPEKLYPAFINETEQLLRQKYTQRENGKILMPFPRLFMVLHNNNN